MIKRMKLKVKIKTVKCSSMNDCSCGIICSCEFQVSIKCLLRKKKQKNIKKLKVCIRNDLDDLLKELLEVLKMKSNNINQ